MPGIFARVKAFAEQVWYPPATPLGSYALFPGVGPSAYDLRQSFTSSVLMATIFWLMRAAPEAQLVVREQRRGSEDPTPVPRHPLVTLVGRPNEYYAGEALWMSTMLCWCVFGNAYWRIVATRGGEPRELWWVPTWQITPEGTEREFISHYRYTPTGIGTRAIDLPRDQVIHFRHGLDPENPRLGLSPIAPVLREIMTDNEATEWIMALLHNQAVPGLIITPKGDARLGREEIERVKRYITARFTGEHRGEPMALGAPTEVTKIAHSPADMDMTTVHNTAEERVSAVLGVPSAVIGFGTGLENSKVGATMREFVGLAWSNGLIPPQRIMASELERSLLPRFETRLDRFSVGWDYSKVAALQEDEGTKLARYDAGVRGGWILVSDARAAMGLEVVPEDRVYLRSSSLQAVEPDNQLPPEPLPVPPPLRALPGRNDDGEGEGQDEGEETAEGEEAASYADGYDTKRLEAKQGTLEEFVTGLIGRHAGRMNTPPRALLRLAAKLERAQEQLIPGFEHDLVTVLRRYGNAVVTAAQQVIPRKQATLQEMVDTVLITDGLPFLSVRAELGEVYQQHYDAMVELSVKILDEAMDLPLTESPGLQAQLRMQAQERVRLLNLEQEARRTITTTLERARTETWDEDRLTNALRNHVPGGRFSTPEMRARILARTELRYASNLATAGYAEQNGIARVLVLDARLGPTDAECTARNGWIVSPGDAKTLAGVEHPNGTLGFLPLAPERLAPTVEPAAPPPAPVTLDSVMTAGQRLDTAWQNELGPEYATRTARVQQLQAEKDRLMAAYQREKDIDVRNRLAPQYNQSLRAWQDAKAQLAVIQRPALETVLREIRPLGGVPTQWTPGTAARVKRVIADVSESLPREWLQRSAFAGEMDGAIVARGHYTARGAQLRLSGTGSQLTSTAFHELGHRFEQVVPDVLKMEREFYEKRTQALLPRSQQAPENRLQKLGAGYRADEVTRADKFVSRYMGKDYGGRNYELFSMGLESVFTGAYDLSADPEFRQFILGILAIV